MKKVKLYPLLFVFIAVGAMFSCSEKNNDGPAGETGSLKVTFNLSATGKATPMSALIPATSWSNIKSLMIMLYDNMGTVRYAQSIATSSFTSNESLLWENIPIGSYTAVFAANVDNSVTDAFGNKMLSKINGSAANWSRANVLSKDIFAGMSLELESAGTGSAAFPAHLITNNIAYTSREGLKNPAEIFLGYAEGITITAGQTYPTGPAITVTLTREVAMLRMRVDRKSSPTGPGTDIVFAGTGAGNACIVYTRVPESLNVSANQSSGSGVEGGVSGTSIPNKSVVVAMGTTTFRMTEPVTGTTPTDYGFPSGVISGTMLTGDYEYWRDIVVLPNATRNEIIASSFNYETTEAAADRKYYFLISGAVGAGITGYETADGVTLSPGDPVYWYGEATGVLGPNKIREMNIVLVTKGYSVPPVVTDYGKLEITLTAPAPWDGNIVAEQHDW